MPRLFFAACRAALGERVTVELLQSQIEVMTSVCHTPDEALTQLSLGQSRAAVADSLQISENTLRAYIDSARHKLGALNVTHAVALALARGIIVPTGALPKY